MHDGGSEVRIARRSASASSLSACNTQILFGHMLTDVGARWGSARRSRRHQSKHRRLSHALWTLSLDKTCRRLPCPSPPQPRGVARVVRMGQQEAAAVEALMALSLVLHPPPASLPRRRRPMSTRPDRALGTVVHDTPAGILSFSCMFKRLVSFASTARTHPRLCGDCCA